MVARGTALGLAIVATMAAVVTTLGVTGAFSHEPLPGDALGRRPVVTIERPLTPEVASGHVYRLVPPQLTRADAQRVFAAAGVTTRVRRRPHHTFGADRGAMLETPMGWLVIVPTFFEESNRPPVVVPVPPSPAGAIATAQRTLAAIGIPADRFRVDAADLKTGMRTVEADRVLNGAAVGALGWLVDVGPGNRVEGLSGLLTDVVDKGRVPIRTSTTVARTLGNPATATVLAPVSDQLHLWAVTVGTNMMGYTPVFGSSVKYVLLGSGRCGIVVDGSANRGCFLRAPTAVRVLAAQPAIGIIAIGAHGATFIVPSYRFSIQLSPRSPHQPRETTITVAAVDPAALTRLARPGG